MLLQLVHHRAVPQTPHILRPSLHPSGRHLNDLLRVQTGQALPHIDAVELGHKGLANLGSPKIDEPVADIALVPEVDRQVHEVELAVELDVELFDEHLTRVLVGYVSQHYGRVVADGFLVARRASLSGLVPLVIGLLREAPIRRCPVAPLLASLPPVAPRVLALVLRLSLALALARGRRLALHQCGGRGGQRHAACARRRGLRRPRPGVAGRGGPALGLPPGPAAVERLGGVQAHARDVLLPEIPVAPAVHRGRVLALARLHVAPGVVVALGHPGAGPPVAAVGDLRQETQALHVLAVVGVLANGDFAIGAIGRGQPEVVEARAVTEGRDHGRRERRVQEGRRRCRHHVGGLVPPDVSLRLREHLPAVPAVFARPPLDAIAHRGGQAAADVRLLEQLERDLVDGDRLQGLVQRAQRWRGEGGLGGDDEGRSLCVLHVGDFGRRRGDGRTRYRRRARKVRCGAR
mmetsp:Transcript_73573/g.206577  ORF Transcript_73573/g.206577 Transcript_73573/m.206577 type:complete len:463 (+) Transcript_73573:402-1790(+)